MLSKFNQLFPLWALLLCITAFFTSGFFSAFEAGIIPLLGMVMFLMGLNLKTIDFLQIIKEPKPVLVGVMLQFVLMPVFALTLSAMLQLSNQLTVGMVLVGCCAGGTASNVICYLAKGELALSISMTLASTLIGVILTPALAAFYLSESVSVDIFGMLQTMLKIVLMPLIVGCAINHFAPAKVAAIEFLLPTLAIALILMIISIIVALNANRLADIGVVTMLAVVLHNLGGLMGGFYISRLFGFDLRRSQTIAIEVGMQNSGLGVALALQYFSATAALPGALFSVWHNISGSLLASHWSKKRSSLEYILQDDELKKAEP
ncbi:MAG: BASS family bile acid:Na+ symporter [Pseudohongiellaceae bacterium]|jgi:BASS family bile acid:Na+ symporter